jgi:tRNA A-37 threonylcarbamoyl transferase component Bud32
LRFQDRIDTSSSTQKEWLLAMQQASAPAEGVNNQRNQFRSRFKFKQEIGRGGMGEVYLARDEFMQRDVAIKAARLAFLEDPENGQRHRRMWLNETRVAGKLHHPHIVEIYESGIADDFAYLIMEYVPGGTLKKFTTPGTLLGVDTVIEVLYKICNALDYAATQGLLHRDIKPANILLADEHTPKITDFGTCYFTDADVTQVFDVGTLPFIPPEHFNNATPTVQSDIYAAGVMAYQLLTGSLPFEAASYESMIQQKLNGEFTVLEKRRRDIPAELRFAVHRALQKSRELRYMQWREFGDDLALALPALGPAPEVVFESARFAKLKGLCFFTGFSDTELWETIAVSEWSDKAPGEVVCLEGTTGRKIHVIATGQAAVTSAGVMLNRLGPGDCVGEMAYLDDKMHACTATVTAASALALIEIDADVLRDASDRLQAAFGRAFMRAMVERVKRADQRFLAQHSRWLY